MHYLPETGYVRLPQILGNPTAQPPIPAVIPVGRYAMPGSDDGVAVVNEALARADVFMLAGNGAFAVGRDVMEAYLRLELLEHLLLIEAYARSMGPMLQIPPGDLHQLLEKRAALGLGPLAAPPAASPPPPATDPAQGADELIRRLIADELRQILKK